MNIDTLKKYQKFYKSAECMGSARILREYLGLDEKFPIPLSISHGVDMNHCPTAMDVQSVEPIHWSCNNTVHERAQKVKPSVKLPHPWLILKSDRPPKTGAGVLVIGPPPGKTNDNALINCLRNLNIKSYDLLLKYRGEIDSSQKFWEANGVKVVSAGERDAFFYDRLFDLIENYEYVIGCTLSSALFFSSSIGCKCKVIEDYTYSAYDTPDYLDFVDFNSLIARKFVNLMKTGDFLGASALALNVLGEDFLINRDRKRNELFAAIIDIKKPFHFGGDANILTRQIILLTSQLFGKTGLIRHGFLKYFKGRINNKVSIIKINEIDIWINGLNKNNFTSHEVEYIRNVTEPGWAVD